MQLDELATVVSGFFHHFGPVEAINRRPIEFADPVGFTAPATEKKRMAQHDSSR